MDNRYVDEYWMEVDPPIPIVRGLRLSTPNGEWGTEISAIVDSGADRSLVPVAAVSSALELTRTRHEVISGVSSHRIGATSLELRYEIPNCPMDDSRLLFIAYGREAIIGRDILNKLKAVLDGPPMDGGETPRLTLISPSG